MKLEALDPLHVRIDQGYVKPSKEVIAAARAKALQSSEYHKLTKLKGWRDSSSSTQVKNGTINFKINDEIDVQCTSTLAIRFKGPHDHQAQKIKVPDDVLGLPLEDAYVRMLSVIYERFKGFSNEHHDITEAKGYNPNAADLSLKYRGITSIAGINGKRFQRVDLSGNTLKDLKCSDAKIGSLIVPFNLIETLEGMPDCNYLDITGNSVVLDFDDEWKHLPKNLERIRISNAKSLNIGCLFLLNKLKGLHLDMRELKITSTQYFFIQNSIQEILDQSHRSKKLLDLQAWLSDNDLEDQISIFT